MTISGFFQLIIGIFAGLAILAAASTGAAYYFFTQMATMPPRHTFEEEKPQSKNQKPVKSAPAAAKKAAPSPSPAAPKPTSSPQPEAGTYKARVTWPDGLILRDSPSNDANKINSIPYNQQLIVVKETSDKQWQLVRVADTQQEGWIRSGNVEKIN